MNKERRKALANIKARIEKWSEEFSKNVNTDALSDLYGSLQDVRDAEQELYDNMSETAQAGEKGSAAEMAIESLQEAMDKLDEVIEAINAVANDLDEVCSSIDSAVEG